MSVLGGLRNMDLDANRGLLVSDFMTEMERLTDAELRALVHQRLSDENHRRAFDRLAQGVSHEVLAFLSATTLTHDAMRRRRKSCPPTP